MTKLAVSRNGRISLLRTLFGHGFMKLVLLNLLNRRWVGIVCWALLSGLATAQNFAAELQIDFGFERQAKVGYWTPVRVEALDVEAESCEIEAIDPDGLQVVYPLTRTIAEQTTNQSAASEWSGTFRSGRLDTNAHVRLRDRDGRVVGERRLTVPTAGSPETSFLRQTVHRWLEVGFNTPLLETVPQVQATRSTDWPKLAEIPWGLDGIDGLLISSRVTLSDTAAFELERWLRRGGQVLLSVTTDRAEFQKTRWSTWLSGIVEVRERTRTSDLSGVESFTVFSRKIPTAKLTPVTTFNVQEGRKLAACLEGTLFSRASFGFGQITLIGTDLTQPPFSRWEGRSSLLRRLVFRLNDSTNNKSTEITRLSQSGITDLASQWRAAAIEIPGVSRPSLWGVLGLLLTYGLLIGPIDFVIVHKLLRRPHWTWFTLPLLVTAASIGTLSFARAVNGDALQLTQLDVVDVDVNRQEITSRSWATIYSDKNQRCRIEATTRPPNPLVAATTNTTTLPAQVSWLGFPENSPGGLYRPSGFDLGHSAYRSSSDRLTLDDIPLGHWSSKSFTSEARWVPQQPLIECRLTTLAANDLAGQIVHHFPFTLHDWIVAFEGRIFVPHSAAGEKAKTWEPNQPWSPTSSNVYGREMRGLLTRTKRTKLENKKFKTSEDILIEQERYDPLDADTGDILQMMTLHEAAGGKAYTGLEHASLRAFDVTPLLSLDRAILIARVSELQTDWKINGETRQPNKQHAYVRLLLPVTRESLDTGGLRVLPKFEPAPVPASKTEPPKSVINENPD
ncbi:MAG: hypothetical protein NT013_28365 [Planctomycetia bacterium]|nr:hypothetical protein [Planctomycetia bacterium]